MTDPSVVIRFACEVPGCTTGIVSVPLGADYTKRMVCESCKQIQAQEQTARLLRDVHHLIGKSEEIRREMGTQANASARATASDGKGFGDGQESQVETER